MHSKTSTDDYGRPPYKCGTCKDAKPRLTMLNSPSPRMRPLARMMMGVSDSLRQLRQYQLIKPPIVRARVKEGVLYMPGNIFVSALLRYLH